MDGYHYNLRHLHESTCLIQPSQLTSVALSVLAN